MIYRLFDDAALDAHIHKLQGILKVPSQCQPRRKSPSQPPKRPSPKGVSMIHSEESADREEGVIKFFDATRGFGFCCPVGCDPDDKSATLYVSAHAVKRANLASLDKGDKIRYRREVSKHPGRKPECQQIELLGKAA
jgi:cold shock CspA family protein